MADIWILVKTIDEFDEDLFMSAWSEEPSIEQIEFIIHNQTLEWYEYLIEKSNNQTHNGITYELFIYEQGS
jgi:hypothetical protein